MEYVNVANIIEQERKKRQAQIFKGIDTNVIDHIEKAHEMVELQKGCTEELPENLQRFSSDIESFDKAETEFLLSKIQGELNANFDNPLLKSMKTIALNHLNTEIEKARSGVYADNSLNRKLGRVGQQYGGKKSKDDKGGKKLVEKKAEKSGKEDKVSKDYGPALMGKLMEAWELDSNHSFGERKKWENKLVETLNKMGLGVKWFYRHVDAIANADTGEYDYELEEQRDVNGDEKIDGLISLVREIGDDTENEPNNNKATDSSNVGKLTANDAAEFLSKHGKDYLSYQYGNMDDDDLRDKFEAASKFIKQFEVFDWQQKDEADEYKTKMKKKGYNVIDVGDGSDTIAYALIKKDDVKNKGIDSSNIGKKIISAIKADQGELNNSSAGKKAQMKIVAAAENFMKKNPKVKLSNEDLENIVGGDIDEVEEKYGELKGWNKLNDAIELYFDAD